MFIARQPILNKKKELFGYELLFRSEKKDTKFTGKSSTMATATVMGGLFESGIEKIVDGKRAFINFDYEFIMSDAIELISPNVMVIEVLESVKCDEKIKNRLIYLKKKGYRIALDDFVKVYDEYPLVPLADIIKFDIIATPLEIIGESVKKALRDHKIILAEKIETEQEFLLAKKMGFQLFQGYFFNKPSIVSKASDRRFKKTQFTRMIAELKKEEPSYQVLSEIIESDVNLVYRMMKVISNRKDEKMIDSIKRSLVYMGFKELEKWINVLMLQELADDKPRELLKLSLVRLRFGEFIAVKSIMKKRKLEVAMMCLFSSLDAILDVTMETALTGISLTSDVWQALVEEKGELSSILRLIKFYEKGEWNEVLEISQEIKLDVDNITGGYFEALEWATEVINK